MAGRRYRRQKKEPMIQQVGESIPVLARFRDGRFEPRKFLWGGGVRIVERVTGRWSEHDGQYKIYHFAVMTDTGSCCELSLHTRHMVWLLDRVLAAGG